MHQIRQLFDCRRLANDYGRIFSRPVYQQNIFRFPASPAINDTLSAYRPTSRTGSLNSMEIRCTVPEIFACKRKLMRWAGNGVVVGEVRKTTTVSLLTPMNLACASQIRPRSDSLILRNAPTDRHTDRQTDRQTPALYSILKKLLGYKSCRLTGDEMGFGLIFFKFGIDLNPFILLAYKPALDSITFKANFVLIKRTLWRA